MKSELNYIELIRDISLGGGYDIDYIRSCYQHDRFTRGFRFKSFEGYFASIIMDDYPVSRSVALYAIRNYHLGQ